MPEKLKQITGLLKFTLYNPEELSNRRFKKILKLAAKLSMKVSMLEWNPDHKKFMDEKNILKLLRQVFENITE